MTLMYSKMGVTDTILCCVTLCRLRVGNVRVQSQFTEENLNNICENLKFSVEVCVHISTHVEIDS